MRVGIPYETYPGEQRVALVPGVLPQLSKGGFEIILEAGAGTRAGYPDESYRAKGARSVPSRAELFQTADVIAMVRAGGANRDTGRADHALLRRGQFLVSFLDPLGFPEAVRDLGATGATLFSMELMPRITRAQSMDALSSMATVSGYKAVLLAATAAPRLFPMLTTAAGTLTPAKVLVIGAGVAGLQAIATARRLGAVVSAYDVRTAVKEQINSLGAKFVELPLEIGDAQDARGYAKAQDDAFYRRQRELLGQVVAQQDVVITTALVPGKRAPLLVTADAMAAMQPGSIVVDLAAEQGGNCELAQAGETVRVGGASLLGPVNLPSSVPFHASQMYAKNVSTFLLHIFKSQKPEVDLEDEIVRETLVARDGALVHPRLREAA